MFVMIWFVTSSIISYIWLLIISSSIKCRCTSLLYLNYRPLASNHSLLFPHFFLSHWDKFYLKQIVHTIYSSTLYRELLCDLRLSPSWPSPNPTPINFLIKYSFSILHVHNSHSIQHPSTFLLPSMTPIQLNPTQLNIFFFIYCSIKILIYN